MGCKLFTHRGVGFSMGRGASNLVLLLLALGCGATAQNGARSGEAGASEHGYSDQPSESSEGGEGVFAMLESGECVWIPPEEHQKMEQESRASAERDLVEHDRDCAKGEGFACSLAAFILEEGNAGDKDPRRAVQFRKRAAQHWSTACKDGNFDACAALGDALVEGEGVRQNQARGRELQLLAIRGLSRGCRAGRGDDCHSLGTRYILGAGVKRSWDAQQKYYARAFALRKAACDAGSWNGCRAAAGQVGIGDGVARDRAAANRLHDRAVELALKKCGDKDVEACDYVRRVTASRH